LTWEPLGGIALAAAALLMVYLVLSGTSSFGQFGSDAYGQCDPFCEEEAETPSPTPSATPSPTQLTGINLTIVKTDSPNPVMIDGVLSYTVTVNNISGIAAEDVFVIDTLPSNVSLISSTPSHGSCEGTMCSLGSIIAGESAVISYVALVGEGAESPIVNVVCVRSTFKSNSCDSEETVLVAASSVFSTPNGVPVMGGGPLERGGSTGLSFLLVLGIGLVVAGAVAGLSASRRTTNE
jgi:uncharacterized repeat protein (TIGR01451 family)